MALRKSLSIFALNIVIHDEEKRDYKKLLIDARVLNRIVNLNKTHAATLGSFIDMAYGGCNFVVGNFFKFINIEPPYFDTNKIDLVVDDNGNPVELLPSNIKGAACHIYFALDIEKHRMFIDSKFISPKIAKNFFEKLFMDDALVDIYGSVEVTLHSSMSAIDNMVANNFLRKIDVRIFKPNPIGSNRFDDEILEEANNPKISIFKFLNELYIENIGRNRSTHIKTNYIIIEQFLHLIVFDDFFEGVKALVGTKKFINLQISRRMNSKFLFSQPVIYFIYWITHIVEDINTITDDWPLPGSRPDLDLVLSDLDRRGFN